MNIETIFTERLKGEKISLSHWEWWLKMTTDTKVMATLGGVWDEETAKKKIQWNIQQWENYGHGQWMFFHKVTNEFIGRGGLRKLEVNGKDEIELGYSVMPQHWKNGYATEIGKASVQTGFKSYNYKSIVAFTLTANVGSRKVMEKLNFKFEANITHANAPHVLYRLLNQPT